MNKYKIIRFFYRILLKKSNFYNSLYILHIYFCFLSLSLGFSCCSCDSYTQSVRWCQKKWSWVLLVAFGSYESGLWCFAPNPVYTTCFLGSVARFYVCVFILNERILNSSLKLLFFCYRNICVCVFLHSSRGFYMKGE